jgi:hypothetical protein
MTVPGPLVAIHFEETPTTGDPVLDLYNALLRKLNGFVGCPFNDDTGAVVVAIV